MKKKLLAILTGAAITATCFSALAACSDGKSGNNSGNSNIEQSGNSNSGNSNIEQSGGIEKISEQQFKNALSVFSTEDYWQFEYEYEDGKPVKDIPEEYKGYTQAVKNKIVYSEVYAETKNSNNEVVITNKQKSYLVADAGEKSLSTYASGEVDMGDGPITLPWGIGNKINFDTAALAEKALRSGRNCDLAIIILPCKTDENSEYKYMSDLYGELIFDETDKSYSIKVIYNISDINDSFPAGSSLAITSPEESTLEVSFKFIFENGKIKTLTCDYLSKLSEISDALDMLPDEITYNFSYDEIQVTLPEEVKSAAKL